MYQKPRLERFGTFRELTLYGFVAPDCDGGGVFGGFWKGCAEGWNEYTGEGGGS